MSTIQKFSSMGTSVNTTQLPAIYNRIDWDAIKRDYPHYYVGVFDFGCGRETFHIQRFLERRGIWYFGYDPYWLSEKANAEFTLTLNQYLENHGKTCIPIAICSNTLNVISPWEAMLELKQHIQRLSPYYYISVYPGDKSGQGKESKKDCWQWNLPIDAYKEEEEIVFKQIITTIAGWKYIIGGNKKEGNK